MQHAKRFHEFKILVYDKEISDMVGKKTDIAEARLSICLSDVISFREDVSEYDESPITTVMVNAGVEIHTYDLRIHYNEFKKLIQSL